jgi:hypothetical protein
LGSKAVAVLAKKPEVRRWRRVMGYEWVGNEVSWDGSGQGGWDVGYGRAHLRPVLIAVGTWVWQRAKDAGFSGSWGGGNSVRVAESGRGPVGFDLTLTGAGIGRMRWLV